MRLERDEGRGKGMKEIKKEFKRYGFTHRLVDRDGFWAIFERHHHLVTPHHFECVRIRTQNGREASWGKVEPSEYYPSSKNWGVDGFTYTTLAAAQAKLAKLAQKVVKALGELSSSGKADA